MSLDIPGGHCQAAIILDGPVGTPPYVTTIGLIVGAEEPDMVQVANQVFSCYNTFIMSNTDENLTLREVTVTTEVAPGEFGSVSSDRAPNEGNRDGSSEIISIAAIVKKVSALPGRRGRGRMFLPGVLPDDKVSLQGDINSDYKDALQEDVWEFGTRLNEGNPGDPLFDDWIPLLPVILHNDPPPGLEPSLITNLLVQTRVGQIRRRLR